MTGEGVSDATVPNRWHRTLWAVIAGLLLLPLIAMQVTSEVRWNALDFAAAAALLGGAGAIYEVVTRVVPGRRQRAAIGGVLVGLVVLLWLQGAVGLV